MFPWHAIYIEFTIFPASKIFGACRQVACTNCVHKRYLSVELGAHCLLFDARLYTVYCTPSTKQLPLEYGEWTNVIFAFKSEVYIIFTDELVISILINSTAAINSNCFVLLYREHPVFFFHSSIFHETSGIGYEHGIHHISYNSCCLYSSKC